MKLPSEYLRSGSGSAEYNKEANIVEDNIKPFIGQSPDFAYPKGFPKPVFTRKPSGRRTYNESRGGGNAHDIERFERVSVGLMGGNSNQAVKEAVVADGMSFGEEQPPSFGNTMALGRLQKSIAKKQKVIGKRSPGASQGEEEPPSRGEK